jgi:hypothetical protein
MFQEWDWLIGSAQYFGTRSINVGEKLSPQPKFSSCFQTAQAKNGSGSLSSSDRI